MKITLIYRKKSSSFFSIEKVFSIVRDELKEKVEIDAVELPFTTRGIITVLFNLLYLKWKCSSKDRLYHITGDVHYAVLALPPDRTILTVHDLVFLQAYKGMSRKFLKWIFLDLPMKKIRFITTISEKSRQEILNYSTFPKDNLYLIPNPVDKQLGVNHKTEPHAKPNLLFLGTKPNKNLELTIAALYKLDVHLHIIGRLTALQKKLLTKFNISYMNGARLSDTQLAEAYAKADIILFPSTYEGFGLPMLEGFQCGTTVVTSNIAPMRDIAEDAAFLVNPFSVSSIRNGLLEAINNPTLCEEKRTRGFEIAKKHSPSAIAEAYYQVWTHVWHSRHTAL